MQLPTGTVTFLFTDVGDSTRLWEDHPVEMRAAMRRHDELLRACVEAHDGVVVKSTGDGLMVAFSDATAAVTAAVDCQRALAVEDWPVALCVRMGLHTGGAVAVDGDYHAPAVNRAARVAAVAHPGQIVVSAATAGVADGAVFRDLGEHALKGLPAMRLFQVDAEGLRHDFPALAAGVRAITTSTVPSPRTTFIGRAEEVAMLCGDVAVHRLVTLTGVGGCGKTRLAIEVAARLAPDFPDGACFVDLAPVAEEVAVTAALAAALGLTENPTVDPLARVAAHLEGRAVLVVIDNCEHLVDACAALVESIVAGPGATRVLVTSREPLAVDVEHVHSVRSLDPGAEALDLFVERSRQARAGLVLGAVEREAATDICRRLDGMPLAIELAAAQVAYLSIPQILGLLDDRFRLLVGGRRRVPRQQTLAATLDWSHDLLDETDQVAFRRLAVFPASFTLDAADAVVGPIDALHRLASLVSKSLLDVIDDGEVFRYRMLETVRMYAEQKLVDANEADACRSRHRDWVVGWLDAMPLAVRWFGDDELLAIEPFNIRAALEWSDVTGHAACVARIASGIDWARGDARAEGMRWCERALAMGELPAALELQVLTNLTVLAVTGLAGDSERWVERSVESSREDPSALLAVTLAWRAAIWSVQADRRRDARIARDALACANRAVAMSDREPIAWQMYCKFVAGMAYASLAIDDADARRLAESHFEQAAVLDPRTSGFTLLRASLFEYVALFDHLAGRQAEALRHAQQAPSAEGRWPMFGQNGSAVRVLALAASGFPDEARSQLRSMHDTFLRNDVPEGRRTVCMYAGAVAAIEGDWDRAARLLAAGRAGIMAGAEAALVYFHYRGLTRAAVGPDRGRELRAEGMQLPLDAAIELALLG